MDPLEEDFVLPPIATPSIASSGALVGNTALVLGPGDVHYDSILMMGGSSLTVVGPARLVVDDFLMRSNSALHFDATAGEIELYATADFELREQLDGHHHVELGAGRDPVPRRQQPDGLAPRRLELGANSEFIGAIYAPNAEFSLASNFNIYGSIMCGMLDLSSFGQIHFDEALLYDGYGSTGELESLLWRVLPRL